MSLVANTLVLDSEGLSAWIQQDRTVERRIQIFYEQEATLALCANTIIEATRAGTSIPRLNWLLSRVKVEPVTEESAKAAARLLKDAGLHGHKYAIDATVAEMALRQPGPVVMMTSDLDDMARLCGDRIRLMGI
ncbi:PIN domain-containing protein [Streptomyces tirandamycinicus]|uniref:DNA-binding protein n=1 Tax=Streptomyces tirandamycinicus TaxID=2174846 RepID=A0A2S1STF2_9ACTN|nr:PIN domain-containing protein [Streptomyces tirandamycinicus]AWI29679.1 DNA-binding protein [Streptomyces tirandamycinicus]